MSSAAGSVQVVEVGPRDGLQNESAILSTGDKIDLIQQLVAAGATRIEATSFVHPRLVPQMADAEAVAAALPRVAGVRYSALALNDRGLDRALAAGLDEINVVVVCSETFGRRNQGAGIDDMIDTAARIIARTHAAGLPVTVTLAAAFGCPFEGEVPLERVAAIAGRIAQAGPDEVAIADTIGVGVPGQVRALTDLARQEFGGTPLRWHFHNTRNTGYANVQVAVDAGAAAIDASVGGVGGCPFAPAATGNVATQDVAYLLERQGISTGLDLPALIATSRWLGERLGAPTPSLLDRAGLFPAE
jgi:hydroxymethylglutaryl-CoA lyase